MRSSSFVFKYFNVGNRRVTTVEVSMGLGKYQGASICMPQDKAIPRIGRRIALSHAISGMDRAARKEVFNAYYIQEAEGKFEVLEEERRPHFRPVLIKPAQERGDIATVWTDLTIDDIKNLKYIRLLGADNGGTMFTIYRDMRYTWSEIADMLDELQSQKERGL